MEKLSNEYQQIIKQETMYLQNYNTDAIAARCNLVGMALIAQAINNLAEAIKDGYQD